MKGSKHILFISSWYPHPANPTHGIFNRHFAEAASAHQRVTVLHVLSENNSAHQFRIDEDRSGDIYTMYVYYPKVTSKLPLVSQWLKRKRMLTAYDAGYERLIGEMGKPDLVQLNVAMPAGIGVLHLASKYNLPYILNEGWTGYMPQDGSYKGWLLRWFTKKIVSRAKLVMPVSQRLEQAMKDQGLDGTYQVVPNVVNTKLFNLASQPGPTPFRWIHISTLDQRQKNIRGILAAFQQAIQTQPAMQLTLVGDGAEKTLWQQEVRDRGLQQHVRFTGVLLKEQIVREIQQHHALLMFSNYESFCVVLAEAMACGKPIVTSCCGGLTDQITSDLGYAVAPGNVLALCKAMLALQQNYASFDPVKIRQFVNERFTQTRVGQQLNSIYESVISATNA